MPVFRALILRDLRYSVVELPQGKYFSYKNNSREWVDWGPLCDSGALEQETEYEASVTVDSVVFVV